MQQVFLVLLISVTTLARSIQLKAPSVDRLATISNVIVQTLELVCPSRSRIEIFIWDYNLSLEQENLLNTVLRNDSLSKIVWTRREYVKKLLFVRNDCGIMFRETNDQPVTYVESYRQIWILSEAAFSKLSKTIKRYYCPDILYLVYDRPDSLFRFGNCFQRRWFQWKTLSNDPTYEQQKNVWGYTVGAKPTSPIDDYLMNTMMQRSNGTYDKEGMDFFYFLHHMTWATWASQGDTFNKFIDLHRQRDHFVIVPRSGRKPLMDVLTDPYDWYTWVCYILFLVLITLIRHLLVKRSTVLGFLKSFTAIANAALTGDSLTMESERERRIYGVFVLLNIVLIEAYQSMVISFLLSPRWYPEVDTHKQLNDLCCWTIYAGVGKRIDGDQCVLDNPSKILCVVRPSQDVADPPELTDDSRISKARMYPLPLLAMYGYKSPIEGLFTFYGDSFFEGNLYRYYQVVNRLLEPEDEKGAEEPVALTISDVSLAWIVLAAGAAVSGSCFVAEMTWIIVKKVVTNCSCLHRITRRRTFLR